MKKTDLSGVPQFSSSVRDAFKDSEHPPADIQRAADRTIAAAAAVLRAKQLERLRNSGRQRSTEDGEDE